MLLSQSIPQISNAQGIGYGNNFRAAARSQMASPEEYEVFTKPDAMGAIGPDHIMILVNGRYAVFDKSGFMGIDRAPIDSGSLNDFWESSAGINDLSTLAFDPRVTYDPRTQRWYATAIDERPSSEFVNEIPYRPNHLLFAVSDSSNPAGGWTGFRFAPERTNSSEPPFALDYPSLGFDASNIYIGATDSRALYGPHPVIAIPKSDLLSGDSIAQHSVFELPTTSRFPQMAEATDGLGIDDQDFHVWRGSDVDPTVLYVSRIEGSGTGDLSLGPEVSIDLGGSGFGLQLSARQPPYGNPLVSGDLLANNGAASIPARLVRFNNAYWGAYSRDLDGDSVIRWFQIDADMLESNPSGAEIDSGEISVEGADAIYPSLAVNENGDVVIGFTLTGPSQFASGYAAVRRASESTFNAPFPVVIGNAVFDDGRLNPNTQAPEPNSAWGDYSNTVVDPADPNIFWTFQQWSYAFPPVSPTDNWSVQAAELIVYDSDEFYWAAPSNGSFSNATKWLSGSTPGANDHALYSRQGTEYEVTFAGDITNRKASIHQGAVAWDLDGNTYTLSEAGPEAALSIGRFQGSATLTISGEGTVVASKALIGAKGRVIVETGSTLDSQTLGIVVGNNGRAGQVEIQDPVTLPSVLDLVPEDGYVPTVGDEFEILVGELDATDRFALINDISLPLALEVFPKSLSLAVVYVGGIDSPHTMALDNLDSTCNECIVVRVTLPGDMNFDNSVDDTDFGKFASQFEDGQTDHTWLTGDFDGNGVVNDEDFGIFASVYGLSWPQNGGEQSVPEPSALSLFFIGCLTWFRSRSWRATST
jgi:hypothetical protein